MAVLGQRELFTAAGLQYRVSLGLNSLEMKIGTALCFTVASSSCEADNTWSLLLKKQHWGLRMELREYGASLHEGSLGLHL